MYIQIFLVSFAIIYFTYGFTTIIKILRKQERREKMDIEMTNKEKPFRRKDYKRWNLFEIYTVGLLVFPLRAMLFILFTFTYMLCVKVVMLFENKQPYSRFGAYIIKKTGHIVVDLIVKVSGFHHVKQKTGRIKDYIPDYEENTEEQKKEAPILIYNHVSYLDVIYLITTQFAPSFISKIDVKNYYIVGNICTGLQSIYVKRDVKNDRDNVLELIKERVENKIKDDRYPMIAIAPEGTTSNGEQLISFKKGAFINMSPIQILCLDYKDRHFKSCLDEIDMIDTIFLSFCQLYNTLEVTVFDQLVPEQVPSLKKMMDDPNVSQDELWTEYSMVAKRIMSQHLNIPMSDAGYSDKKTYLQKIKQAISDKKKQE